MSATTDNFPDVSDNRHTMQGDGVHQVKMAYDHLADAVLELDELIDDSDMGFGHEAEDFDKLVASVRRARSILRTALTCHTRPGKPAEVTQ